MKRRHAWILLILLNATGGVLLWVLNTWSLTPMARTLLTINALINAGLGLWLLPKLFGRASSGRSPAGQPKREDPGHEHQNHDQG